MKKPAWMNMNLVGLALLLAGYLAGLGMVLSRSYEEGAISEATGTGKKVVTLMHWQLEPGYREAMQDVMDRYNALPHVRAANVEVRQLDVSERVYAQVLNVHLISGTAPDLSEKGKSGILVGAGMAQYFDSISGFAEQPNPYNSAEYLPDDMDPKLAEALATMPWRETFIDGMKGGFVPELQDYYSAPTSFFGAVKIFYNVELFNRAKAILNEIQVGGETPDWFEALLLKETDGRTTGYVTDTPELRAWMGSDETPDTLGRLILLCEAVNELGRRTNDRQLVPIAGSSYSDSMFASQYRVPFTSPYADKLDYDYSATVAGAETWMGWLADEWSFEDARLRAYFDCVSEIAGYFPPGFLGLDREQARRRFITSKAAMIATGSWDAKSLFDAAEGAPLAPGAEPEVGQTVTIVDGQPRVDYRFRVEIMDFPLPGPGERWHEFITYPANTAQANGGAMFSIYQRSPNKAWALDFLRYLTSFEVNQRFNYKAGWLPITLGAEPQERLAPFQPTAEGLDPGTAIGFGEGDGRQLRTRFDGQLRNFLAGDISYETFINSIASAAADEQSGAKNVIAAAEQTMRDSVRSFEQLLNTQIAATELMGQSGTRPRHHRSVRQSALLLNANDLPHAWHQKFPDEPFPEN